MSIVKNAHGWWLLVFKLQIVLSGKITNPASGKVYSENKIVRELFIIYVNLLIFLIKKECGVLSGNVSKYMC